VALVYDVMDTEGKELPQDVSAFYAHGPIGEPEIVYFRDRTSRRNIQWDDLDAGDGNAGSIRYVKRATKDGERNSYRMLVNRNHSPAVRFATLAHELAHLFLGHLGLDEALHIPARSAPDHRQRELEAESVAFIACQRNSVSSKSGTYLKAFVDQDTTTDDLDIYRIMWAAGQIETLLGLGARTAFDRPRKAR
jgi:IrrE N-terminal-like domain